ncbi:PAS domain S-box protein [Cellvibrio sp. UBA7661]|uniref:PAS domain S-box protein n=1 Tax=Cellvibrio sp. UBA7661 TaxID=1946311 RepID=UPI002F35B491
MSIRFWVWGLAFTALLCCMLLATLQVYHKYQSTFTVKSSEWPFYTAVALAFLLLIIVFAIAWLFEISRTHNNQNLAERETHFRELAETITEVFWLTDITKGKMLYISPGYERIWGRPCDSLYQNPAAWLEPIHPDDRPALLKVLPDQVRGNYRCEYRIIRPDGNIRWIEDRAFPICDESGKVYRIAGLATDITHRKHIEKRLRQQENQLRQAARIARLGSWFWDVRSDKVVLDDEVCKILELPPNTQMPLQQGLDMYPPRWRNLIVTAVNRCLEQGIAYDEELQIITAGGRYLWVRTQGEAIRDAQGVVIRLEGSFQDINEQKHTENLLAQGGQRLQQLANALPIIIWSATTDGTIDYVNDRFSEYTGLDQSQISTQQDWLQVIHSDDQLPAGAAWQNATQHSAMYLTEFRLRDINGNYRWHLARAVPVFNAQREIVRWYGSAIDIHDTKTNEEKAQALADRLTVTLESITDAFVTVDTEWRFTYINQEAEQLLHRSRAELLGRTMWHEFPQIKDSDFEFHYKKAMSEQEKASFEAYYAPLQKWFSVNAYPSSEGLAVYFQDITLRRANEQQLRLMEACIAHMNDMVIITNAPSSQEDGPEIIFVNTAFEKVMGYKREEVVNKNPRFLRSSDSPPEELHKVKDALKNWQPVRAELMNVTKTGEQVQVEIDLVPITDSNGKYTHWVAVERNITERKRIAELEQAHRLAELASQAKSNFLAAMSHEIRTPINGVIGMIEVLQQTQLRGYQTDMIDIIRDSAMSLLNIIEDILDFSKIEAGRLELESRPFSLIETVKKVVQLMEPVAANSNVILTVTNDANLFGYLRGDEQRVRQILLNLMSNAIKFSSKQKQQGMVQLSTHLIAQDEALIALEIRVKDNGIGLSQQQQMRLFRPFAQADASTSRHFGGTGLGLSISYGLIQLMHGSIRVISELSQGAEFIVNLQLPRENKPPQILSSAPVEAINYVSASRTGMQPILVVEDNSINQKVIAYQLELLGYSGDMAANGAQALEKWRQQKYSLILTDLHMPEMDGYEFVKQLRQEELASGYRTPIIALTANALRGEAERCFGLGMDDYLTKPITLESLAFSLKKYLSPAESISSISEIHDDHNTYAQVLDFPEGVADAVDSAHLNLLILQNLVGSDASTIKEFLAEFLVSAQTLAGAIVSAYDNRDWSQLSTSAHTLKSSARAVGAQQLGNICQGIEAAAKKPAPEQIAHEMALFGPAYAAVENEVNHYLTQIH